MNGAIFKGYEIFFETTKDWKRLNSKNSDAGFCKV